MVGKAGAEVPLMTGKADVTVGANRESRLEMALSYAVTAIDLVLSGIPSDVDLVFDVRFLPNPFYIDELKQKAQCCKNVIFTGARTDVEKILPKAE